MLILLKVSSSFINLVDILFVVEMSDERLRYKNYVETMCETWLTLIPIGNVIIFSDTNTSLPNSCHKLNLQKSLECCDNSKLGENILSAQMKREFIHQKLFLKQHLFLKNIKWIVSTEQDVWWNVNKIPDYINSRMVYSSLIETRAFFGHWVGPFEIVNKYFLENYLGNKTHINVIKEQGIYHDLDYLKTNRRKGSKYHNDHLVFSLLAHTKNKNDVHVRLCTERSDISNHNSIRKFELSSYLFYANALNITPQIIFSSFSHHNFDIPKKLLAFHRFGNPDNLKYLHNLYYYDSDNHNNIDKNNNNNNNNNKLSFLEKYSDNNIIDENNRKVKLLKSKQLKLKLLNFSMKNEDMFKTFNETKYVLTKLKGNYNKLSNFDKQYLKNLDMFEKKCFLIWNKLISISYLPRNK